jgi:hypothetical protein
MNRRAQMNKRFFTEYRHKDYVTPRSMKEAYGWEPPLYVEEKSVDAGVVAGAVVVCSLFSVVALYVWLI